MWILFGYISDIWTSDLRTWSKHAYLIPLRTLSHHNARTTCSPIKIAFYWLRAVYALAIYWGGKFVWKLLSIQGAGFQPLPREFYKYNSFATKIYKISQQWGELNQQASLSYPTRTFSLSVSLSLSQFIEIQFIKSGNSANGTAAYLITSVSSPRLLQSSSLYLQTKYIKHHCLFSFSFKHINSRRNVVQGKYMHYNETKYYIKHCLFSFSF